MKEREKLNSTTALRRSKRAYEEPDVGLLGPLQSRGRKKTSASSVATDIHYTSLSEGIKTNSCLRQ